VNITVTDALHAYEEGTNHTCLMPLLFYGHPQYLEQLMLAAKTTEKWMLPSEKGMRFRTNDFGWETAQQPPPQPAQDVSDTAVLLLHPHLMLAWYNGDPRALKTVTGYLDDRGDDVPYAYGGGMTASFGAYWLTGDPKYLHLTPHGKDARGQAWARFRSEFVVHGKEARQQPWWPEYVQRTGRQANLGDWAWAASQDRETLAAGLESVLWGTPGSGSGGAERFRYVWTEAEQFTDRVYLPIELVAQAMLGGYNVRNRLWPAYAVSYEQLGGDFAALVLEQGRDRLTLAMVNLRETPRTGAFRVWQLDHGRYELRVGPDANDDGRLDSVQQTKSLTLKRMDAVPVELPARQLIIYELRQTEKLDDIYVRPDLALSEADVERTDNAVRVTVHNLGRSAAQRFCVSLADAAGKVLASQTIDALPPPRDLTPSRTTVELPPTHGATRVLLDPDDRVAELTELNNAAPLPVSLPEVLSDSE
jgi:hypothetical protein